MLKYNNKSKRFSQEVIDDMLYDANLFLYIASFRTEEDTDKDVQIMIINIEKIISFKGTLLQLKNHSKILKNDVQKMINLSKMQYKELYFLFADLVQYVNEEDFKEFLAKNQKRDNTTTDKR